MGGCFFFNQMTIPLDLRTSPSVENRMRALRPVLSIADASETTWVASRTTVLETVYQVFLPHRHWVTSRTTVSETVLSIKYSSLTEKPLLSLDPQGSRYPKIPLTHSGENKTNKQQKTISNYFLHFKRILQFSCLFLCRNLAPAATSSVRELCSSDVSMNLKANLLRVTVKFRERGKNKLRQCQEWPYSFQIQHKAMLTELSSCAAGRGSKLESTAHASLPLPCRPAKPHPVAAQKGFFL